MLQNENYVSAITIKERSDSRAPGGTGIHRVGYLGCAAIPVNADRKRGYLIGTIEAAGTADLPPMAEVNSVGEVGQETIRLFVDRGCDAVMCFNDNVAIRFIKGLSDMGRKVPDDMAVTGFDDSPLRRVFSPSITTMSLSTFEMGFFAARWLRDNIQHRESRRIQLEVNGTLIVGESTTRGGTMDKEQHRPRAALITGGSAGIGRAIALALAAERYTIIISGRRPDRRRPVSSVASTRPPVPTGAATFGEISAMPPAATGW